MEKKSPSKATASNQKHKKHADVTPTGGHTHGDVTPTGGHTHGEVTPTQGGTHGEGMVAEKKKQ